MGRTEGTKRTKLQNLVVGGNTSKGGNSCEAHSNGARDDLEGGKKGSGESTRAKKQKRVGKEETWAGKRGAHQRNKTRGPPPRGEKSEVKIWVTQGSDENRLRERGQGKHAGMKDKDIKNGGETKKETRKYWENRRVKGENDGVTKPLSEKKKGVGERKKDAEKRGGNADVKNHRITDPQRGRQQPS